MIDGIDVSNNNGAIGWDAVAGFGYQFAIAKASEGTRFVDRFFPANWQDMHAVGLVRGAYHFAQPDQSTAADEAAHFLACLQAAGGLLPGDVLALDLEEGSGNLLAWALDWLGAVEAAVGFKPLFYSRADFMAEHNLLGSALLGQYGLWLAAYQAGAPEPPAGWEFWALWQHSASGSVPGVSGACDLDRFNGTIAQLQAYGLPVADPCAQLRADLTSMTAERDELRTRLKEVRAAVDDFV